MLRLILVALILLPLTAFAHPYDPMIDAAARGEGLDPILFRAVVQAETQKQPWSFNCDGEGFHFDTRDTAIMALWQISQNPWLVKIVDHEEVIRQFFQTRGNAQAFLNAYRASQQRTGRSAAAVRTDSEKSVNEGEARIRQLWVVNTDIGIAQVNYRFHGVSRARVQQWFDPSYNLKYAASLIAQHKRSGRSDLEAAGDYHSKTPNVRAVYMKRLLPIYQSEKASAFTSIATK
jgi:hypothetical protein